MRALAINAYVSERATRNAEGASAAHLTRGQKNVFVPSGEFNVMIANTMCKYSFTVRFSLSFCVVTLWARIDFRFVG